MAGKSKNTFTREVEVVDAKGAEEYFYKLSNIRGDTADFEYTGSIQIAAAQYNALFDNIAKTTGYAQEATGYKIEKKGTVRKEDDKWVVKEPLILHFTR